MLGKKVLIIANNALSDSNSNGRTLKSFFGVENAEKLAQVYLQSDSPDFRVCKKFFRVSDREVVLAVLKRTSAGREVQPQETPKQTGVGTVRGAKIARNPLTMLIRDGVWSRRGWRGALERWIAEFAPEAVLLQAGDSPFLFDLAVETADRYGVPLAIYNSEDYYFKDYNYFRRSGVTAALYPAFRRRLRGAVQRAMARADLTVYISEDLKALYDGEFRHNSAALYTATENRPQPGDRSAPVFSYLGNLGLDRHRSLIEIGAALRRIDPAYHLDIYGKLPNDEVRNALERAPGVRYCGFVGYEEVQAVTARSMLLFHAESFEPFYRRDVRYGFSTKIADALASGTCFVLYAPAELSCARFLRENGCACVVDAPEALEGALRALIADPALREKYVRTALAVAEQNHSAEKNRLRFEQMLNELGT